MTARVVLHRDPTCRGSIGGRYSATTPDGTVWEVDGTPGLWHVFPAHRHLQGDDLREWTRKAQEGALPGTVTLSLAAARTWLAAYQPRQEGAVR